MYENNNVMMDAMENVTEAVQQLPQVMEIPEEAGFGVLELVISGVAGVGAGIGGTVLFQKIRKHRAEKKAQKEAFKEFQAQQAATAAAVQNIQAETVTGDVVDTPPVNN